MGWGGGLGLGAGIAGAPRYGEAVVVFVPYELNECAKKGYGQGEYAKSGKKKK